MGWLRDGFSDQKAWLNDIAMLDLVKSWLNGLGMVWLDGLGMDWWGFLGMAK